MYFQILSTISKFWMKNDYEYKSLKTKHFQADIIHWMGDGSWSRHLPYLHDLLPDVCFEYNPNKSFLRSTADLLHSLDFELASHSVAPHSGTFGCWFH